jgi:phosphohistidine swiveling domain-containing protein
LNVSLRYSWIVPFRSLDELVPADAARVGGKAWNCARLKQHGLPVPDGLVVFADTSDADLAALETDSWFDRQPPDARFAVRSSGLDEDSAAESFAGIHETHLNIARSEVLTAANGCRASADSERARAYRRARGMSDDAGGVGVLVQRMVPATVSGVAFTIDPVTSNSDEMVINAAPGLGVAVVDGRVDPDEIRIRKTDRQIASYRAATMMDRPEGRSLQRSLDASQVAELASLLTAIEDLYGSPQDVEWCLDGTQFWIVQSRPITTHAEPRAALPGKEVVDIEWTRANLAEVLPDLTSPQALSAIEEMLNVAERNYMGGFLAPYDELGPMVRSFCGRLYFNLSQMRRICVRTRTAPAAVLRSLGHSGPIPPEDEITPKTPLLTLAQNLPDFARILGRHLRARKLFRAHQAKIDGFLKELARADPSTLPDDRIWAEIAGWQQRSAETIEVVLLFGGVLFHEQQLRAICDRVGFPFERLLYSQLAAGERSVSAQQAFDLVALADSARADSRAAEWLSRSGTNLTDMRAALAGTPFLREFERFLDRYGHRGLYESDWALPRYSEDPSPLLQAIRMHLHAGTEPARANGVDIDGDAATIKAEFERQLTGIARWTLLPRARQLLATIKRYYVWREQCRSDMIRVAAVLRRWHLVLADRFVERGWLDTREDYFFLLLGEIAEVISARGSTLREPQGRPEPSRRTTGSPRANLRATVARRRSELERNRRIEMPLLMHESELPRVIARARQVHDAEIFDDDTEMRGTPVSRGAVEADVVVISDPGDFRSMKRGAILVTRATDPSWTPLFTLASGVIVEVGGILSHASTIAREYGLPALANVKQATRRLKTGDRILLNATEGWVRRC